MADAARDIPRMIATEYLQMERQATSKHEFVNGIVYAMAGGSREHNFISGDSFAALLGGVRPPCQVFTSDMRVHIRPISEDCYYSPDTTVTCSDLDNHRDEITQPSLVVEVLSGSTEKADRGYTFEEYKKLPSLQEYVLVHQEPPCVETYRRRTSWRKETCGFDQETTFESVGLRLQIAAPCLRVRF